MRDRDKHGRFTKGNAGGPGRPPRRTEEEYLVTLCEAVSLADWRKIVAKAVADAKEGDGKARDWLGRYLIGDPQPEESDVDDAAELAERRLALIESYLRPLGLVDDRYPAEEMARCAAVRLAQVDADRLARGNCEDSGNDATAE